MKISGLLYKMRSVLKDENTVSYSLVLSDRLFPLDVDDNRRISIRFTGRKNCISCGLLSTELLGNGFCPACYVTVPEAAECIFHPELCKAHLGEGRDVKWEQEHHNQPHFVYLARTSVIKVGVTRETQIPTRWIDQGADSAVCIAKTPHRAMAGKMEVMLKKHFADKTPWQKMLKNEISADNLQDAVHHAQTVLSNEYSEQLLQQAREVHFRYPVKRYPNTVKSVQLSRNEYFEGILSGIRGQYLMLDDGSVLNIRNHTGYHCVVEWS
jgi:hypothetical protein